jgi:hypothetical protein
MALLLLSLTVAVVVAVVVVEAAAEAEHAAALPKRCLQKRLSSSLRGRQRRHLLPVLHLLLQRKRREP